MPVSVLPIAVLISGGGTNLQALIDAATAPDHPYEITVVISDRRSVHGLTRAFEAGIRTEVVDWNSYETREAFTEEVCVVAERYGAEALVLAGFMRILSPIAIERYPDAIINVHPALLPAFPGADAVKLAVEYGATITGVTVHFVDEQVDHGPIITQEALPIFANDTVRSLHTRLQKIEHRLLPEVVAAFGRGDLAVEGRHVRWRPTRTEDQDS